VSLANKHRPDQNCFADGIYLSATAAVNNGNVTKQTITVPTVGQTPGFTAVQDYTYDSLNRLKSAVENITPTGSHSVAADLRV